jgi:hypothetical protein
MSEGGEWLCASSECGYGRCYGECGVSGVQPERMKE